jgi:UDP-N-acetylglucosamine 2-epimerase (non-hydrolysing)
MSQAFFDELGIPKPDFNLGAGGGSQAEQTSKILIGYEELLSNKKPDLCIVVGDVTSTMACSIAAKKMGVKVAHVEGGIRSKDWTMPEEINRVVTDRITDFFFTTSKFANKNLLNEGVSKDQIFLVGNTMIDTLLSNLEKLKKPDIWNDIGLSEENYLVMTLHRPSNVDEEIKLKSLIRNIVESLDGLPIIFPVHPRTRKILKELNIHYPTLHYIDPLGYLEFIFLIKHSKGVITDSGGITEETTVLNIPCLTLRDNTERPETIYQGTNELIGTEPEAIKPAISILLQGRWKKGTIPDKWDGNTAQRIVDKVLELYADGSLKNHERFVNNELLFKIG